MPIPEPGLYRPSNLTRQQKQEQLAAIYGVSMQELSFEEVNRMRQIVANFDGQRKPMQTIDLNNPPKEAYKYQKFPMMVYDLSHSTPQKIVHMLVGSDEELNTALAHGWSEQAPAFSEEREEPLSAQYQAEAERVQDQINEAKAKRGRPRTAA
jgi:hypothetical protein